MRYELIGYNIPHKGKTMWEIVSNLKNFGVGRLFYKHTLLKYPELSFCKIVKVIPIPPPKKQFDERRVMVYVEEILRGQKLPELSLIYEKSHLPNYNLIPKAEEETYLKKAKELEGFVPTKTVPKYLEWPPLYKKLWEQQQRKNKETVLEIPKLKTITQEYTYNIVFSEEVDPQYTSNLYKGDVPVEEMIKEIVKLTKIINKNLTN